MCFRLLFPFTIGASIMAAQAGQAPVRQLRGEAPRPAIEPRTRLDIDPVALLEKLESPMAADRQSAYKALFGQAIDTETKPAPAARLAFIQLDRDAALEATMIVDAPGAKVAFVFDRLGDQWWRIGKFDNRKRDVRESFESMLEIRDIIGSNDGSDIIVRRWGYGTGVRAVRLSIYRLKDGALYRIFETVEEQTDGANEPGVHLFYQRRFLHFPDRDETQGPVMVVHQMEVGVPEPMSLIPESLIHLGDTKDCAAYRWDETIFLLSKDSLATKRFCGGITSARGAKPRAPNQIR